MQLILKSKDGKNTCVFKSDSSISLKRLKFIYEQLIFAGVGDLSPKTERAVKWIYDYAEWFHNVALKYNVWLQDGFDFHIHQSSQKSNININLSEIYQDVFRKEETSDFEEAIINHLISSLK